MPDKPREKPNHKQDWDGEDESHYAGQHDEKGPIFPRMTPGLPEVALQQQIIAAIRLPSNIEGVAKNRDGADQHTDAEVDSHAHEGDVWNAANPRGNGDDEGEQSGEHVSQAGNEADDAIDAESDPCERDAKGFIEQDFKPMQGLVAKEPGTVCPPTWRKHIAFPGE
jgi:hypothetical protein